MKWQKDLVLYTVSGLEEDKIIADKVCRQNKNDEVINSKLRFFLPIDLNLTERWICLNHFFFFKLQSFVSFA